MCDTWVVEQAILRLCGQRRPGATVCPSEVARRLAVEQAAEAGEEAWRSLMPAVREAANRLAGLGLIEVLQRGRVVDGNTARGAIRLRSRAVDS